MPDFRRKTNRLEAESYRGRRAYFLTLCVGQRKKLFDDQGLVNGLLDVLRKTCLSECFQVYAYCFMPNHLHLILAAEKDSCDLAALAQAFKGASTAVARSLGVSSLWQKGFYDHVLRSGESLDEAAWYVFMNPVRAGLAKCAELWPYSGSFAFEWRKFAAPATAFVPPWKGGMER